MLIWGVRRWPSEGLGRVEIGFGSEFQASCLTPKLQDKIIRIKLLIVQ